MTNPKVDTRLLIRTPAEPVDVCRANPMPSTRSVTRRQLSGTSVPFVMSTQSTPDYPKFTMRRGTGGTSMVSGHTLAALGDK